MLIGFNGFMWSQAVIVEVYTLSVLSLVGMLCCLLRWLYALEQRRYLYWASFLFGICFTNHQTLIVAAMMTPALAELYAYMDWNQVSDTLKVTDATPTLSEADAVRWTIDPGAACEGAPAVTVGFSLSGIASIVSVASAMPTFEAASRAVARTWMLDPGVATAGTSIARWYGGATSAGPSAPSTANVTLATPTLSSAAAVTVSVVPGSTLDGAEMYTCGATRSGAAAIAADVVADA